MTTLAPKLAFLCLRTAVIGFELEYAEALDERSC